MLIGSCFDCEFHLIKEEEKEQISYCQKENCWSRFSKCLAKKALDRFLEFESSEIVLSSPSAKPLRDGGYSSSRH